MIAKCPNNCPSEQFVTVAHVTEDWVVDAQGDFISVQESLETTHGPDSGNTWTCNSCGTEAKVEG